MAKQAAPVAGPCSSQVLVKGGNKQARANLQQRQRTWEREKARVRSMEKAELGYWDMFFDLYAFVAASSSKLCALNGRKDIAS